MPFISTTQISIFTGYRYYRLSSDEVENI